MQKNTIKNKKLIYSKLYSLNYKKNLEQKEQENKKLKLIIVNNSNITLDNILSLIDLNKDKYIKYVIYNISFFKYFNLNLFNNTILKAYKLGFLKIKNFLFLKLITNFNALYKSLLVQNLNLISSVSLLRPYLFIHINKN